jgi:septal ring factor EnvC (AmiA/AmiB activator)
VALALKGRKVGFGKVIEMIEELVATLQQEQRDDDKKKGFCEAEFDKADDKKKGLERQGADLETVIAETKENIVGSKEEIKELAAGIKDLDKAVAEATAQRKDENKDYKEVVASDTAAKEILLFAKNRLQKFYNPKLYKAPKKSLAQVSAAPPPPPETAGAYKKKGEETNGVLAMIDLLVQDLDKELTEAKAAEKDAQGDYERTMKDSQEKRTQDSKALSDREDAVAEMEAALVEHKANKKSAAKELAATLKYIQSLHGDCDFLLKYYAVRKEARTGEIDGLGKAKAVLSGADYSL